MTNRHVLDRLPFWIAGDLDAPETEAVQAHLNQCLDCRAAADGMREGRAWLREALEPPFDATDHARLRGAILAQICHAEPPRRTSRLTPRAAILVTTAAALVVLALTHPLRHLQPVPPLPAPPPPTGTGISALQAASGTAPSRPGPPRLVRARAAPRQTPDEATGPTRIEFQTSDPTIHIIWLAQATPRPEPDLSQEEP